MCGCVTLLWVFWVYYGSGHGGFYVPFSISGFIRIQVIPGNIVTAPASPVHLFEPVGLVSLFVLQIVF